MQKKIRQLAEEINKEAVELRRHLHACPELAFCEQETASFVADYLKNLGLLVKTGVAKTGVVAYLDAGKPDTLLMRADMDALPMTEIQNKEYKSKNQGVMHACGHDAHMAVVLCCAKVLVKLKDALSQNVLFVFQPAEEGAGGAEPMIETGILEEFHVTKAVGLHVMNDVPVGKVLLKEGPMMAAPDDFDLYIHGRGGHGALPHACVNPIALSAKVIAEFDMLGMQCVTPFVQKVISVCSIEGGTTYNVIPDTVHMRGTVRTYDETVRKELPKWMERSVSGICNTYGATYEFLYHFRYPPLINDKEAVDRMKRAVSATLGEDCVIMGTEPSMTGEDFAYFAKAVPSVYFYLGSGNEKRGIQEPLHSAKFEIDEDCLKVGIAAMLSYALCVE